ncbi:MAG: hypothetical protein ABSG64_02925 [Solirubrobacteraceae bacterium]|jgi:hypothetical protein
MTSIDDLATALERGLHQKNVGALLRISMELAAHDANPVALYVVASVLGDLDAKWDSRPVKEAQTGAAEKDLQPLLRLLIADIRRNASDEVLAGSMNRLVARFIALQNEGALG